MTRKTTLYLQDILEHMRLAERFVEGLTHEQFTADQKTAYAVLRCLEVIGEAAKGVPSSVREQYPAIPWKEMAGMRDRLIHFTSIDGFDIYDVEQGILTGKTRRTWTKEGKYEVVGSALDGRRIGIIVLLRRARYA